MSVAAGDPVDVAVRAFEVALAALGGVRVLSSMRDAEMGAVRDEMLATETGVRFTAAREGAVAGRHAVHAAELAVAAAYKSWRQAVLDASGILPSVPCTGVTSS